MATIRTAIKKTATDTDVQAGSLLEFIPGPGLLRIWQASTVDTATFSLDIGGEGVVRSQAILLRASGVPSQADDPSVDFAGVGGEKVLFNLGGTTGTCFIICEFTPLDEL